MDTDAALTLAQVARRLHCSERTVQRRIASGELEAFKTGPGNTPIHVYADSVQRLIDRSSRRIVGTGSRLMCVITTDEGDVFGLPISQ